MLPILAGLAIGGLLVAVALLTFEEIKEWFIENTEINKEEVRVLVQDKLSNGKYKVVSLGFNLRKKSITASKTYEAEDRDDELIRRGTCVIRERF